MAESLILTGEMIWVLGILAFAVTLFVTEVVTVDVAALCVLVLLGVSGALAPWLGLDPLLTQRQLFSGFSSRPLLRSTMVGLLGTSALGIMLILPAEK